MNVEIEAKMRIADPAELTSRLQGIAGDAVAEIIETDVFLDTAEKRLRSHDCGLRVRAEAHLLGETPDRTRITYKGPRETGPIKRREELELTVGSVDHAVLLLQRLGYHVQISFQKHRRRWHLNDCYIEVDHLPYLGDFVEIEGPTEEAVLAIREVIGLADHAFVQDPYVGILEQYLLDHDIGDRDIRLPEHKLQG